MSNEMYEKLLSKLESISSQQKAVLTLDEVADYTKLSKSYLYKLTSSGKIPFYCPNGKQLFFNRLELEAWLLQNRSKSNEEIEQEVSTSMALRKYSNSK